MKVFGDNVLVEIKKAAFTTSEDDTNPANPLSGSGVVIGIPDEQDILYFGSFNWAFENSMLDDVTRKNLIAVMKRLVGKTIYWEGRADVGMTLVDDSEHKLIAIKLSKIVGVEN